MTADLFLTLLLAVSLVGLLGLAILVLVVVWVFRVTRGMKGGLQVALDFDGRDPVAPPVNLFNAEKPE